MGLAYLSVYLLLRMCGRIFICTGLSQCYYIPLLINTIRFYALQQLILPFSSTTSLNSDYSCVHSELYCFCLFYKNSESVLKSILRSHELSLCPSRVRIRLWALPERLWNGGQPFLWGGRGGRRLCHVKQPLQQPHQHVAGGSPWRQGWGSTQRDHKAQVSGAVCHHSFLNGPLCACFHHFLSCCNVS